MIGLADTISACRLPAAPLRRLLAANRRDQLVTRYETFEQLLDYCRLSAAPVGELVLHVLGAATPDRIVLSDRICAGLQITEHLQDVREDYARGRIYVPADDLARFGCGDADLRAGLATPPGRALLALEVQRARGLLAGGAPLAGTLTPRPRIAVAGFVAGGRRALDALSRGSDRPAGTRAVRGRAAFVAAFVDALVGR